MISGVLLLKGLVAALIVGKFLSEKLNKIVNPTIAPTRARPEALYCTDEAIYTLDMI